VKGAEAAKRIDALLERVDMADGRYLARAGEVAATMLVHLDLRIRDGKIARYERRAQPE
jgi:hypothetical protein